MARYEIHRLSPLQIKQIRGQFCKVMGLAKNKKEMTQICRALFTDSEMAMFLRRLQVAILLSKGWSNQKISQELKVSGNQIHRVKVSLLAHGEGYDVLIQRLKDDLLKAGQKRSGGKDRRPPYWTMAYWLTLGR